MGSQQEILEVGKITHLVPSVPTDFGVYNPVVVSPVTGSIILLSLFHERLWCSHMVNFHGLILGKTRLSPRKHLLLNQEKS